MCVRFNIFDRLKPFILLLGFLISLTLFGCDPKLSPSSSSVELDLELIDEQVDETIEDQEGIDLLLNDLDLGLEEDQTLPLSGIDGTFQLTVFIDDEPLEGILVTQGGSDFQWYTGINGSIEITLDHEVVGPTTLFASHPQARTRSVTVSLDEQAPQHIQLTRYTVGDNPDSAFSDPGEPRRRSSTAQCGHCHLNINDQWFESPHRTSARNPIVYDLYTGRGSGWRTQEECEMAQGTWQRGQVEGQDELVFQCYFDLSALGAFNQECETAPCDTTQLNPQTHYFGGCADCHAPQHQPTTYLDNQVQLGGQDLLAARDFAFEYGVSCDVCHHVDRIDRDAPAGVAGRLVLQRPHEDGPRTLGAGGYLPLSFGPSPDISNPRMGLSPRAHYQDGSLCVGCHQHQHEQSHALVPINLDRWPEGSIPNQSTFAEWEESAFKDVTPCNECHMPPDVTVMNSAQLETFADADIGIQGGWPRPFGSTRQHRWWGPRQPQGKMLEMAAALHVQPRLIENEWEIQVQTHNVGAGHGLPTGEPMRHILLLVNLECNGTPVFATGGDVVQSIGGATHSLPWTPLDQLRLPQAQVGDWLRVVSQSNEAVDYDGYGPFAQNGRFQVHEKGLYKEEARGQVQITDIDELGNLTLSHPLPEGTYLYLIQNTPQTAPGYAGQAGFSFGRVLKGMNGQLMVPHFVANDLVRDQRIKPNQSWTSIHRFPSSCSNPTLQVRLVYRPYPLWLARQRGWIMWDEVMVSKEIPLDGGQP